MKIINYRDIGNAWHTYAQDAMEEVNHYIAKSSLQQKNINPTIKLQLAHLMAAHGSSDLQGLDILDLACGSNRSLDGRGEYQPHLCRILGQMGASPWGVDIAPSEEEDFVFVNEDLQGIKALDTFTRNIRVDLAHCHGLFDSPRLYGLNKNQTQALYTSITTKLEQIVKPEGFFLWGNNDDIGGIR